MELKKTPLHDSHVKLGARMAEFAGYDMPISYDGYSGGMKKEHLTVREALGIFDVSHMGEFWLRGVEATAFLNHVCTRGFDGLANFRAQYCLLLKDNGTIVDDIIVYKFDSENYWIVVNASNLEKDFKHLQSQLGKFQVKLTDVSPETALIAIQGPQAAAQVEAFFPGASALKYYSFSSPKPNWILGRTGYTGEDGFEVFLPSGEAPAFWQALLDKGFKPIGLGARDTLRLEVGFPLYGHELSEELRPKETFAGFACDLTRDFLGSSAAKQKPRYRPLAIHCESPKPIRAEEKLYLSEICVGFVTSGTSSPIKRQGVALVLVEEAKIPAGQDPSVFLLESGGKRREAFVQGLPFVQTGRVKTKRT